MYATCGGDGRRRSIPRAGRACRPTHRLAEGPDRQPQRTGKLQALHSLVNVHRTGLCAPARWCVNRVFNPHQLCKEEGHGKDGHTRDAPGRKEGHPRLRASTGQGSHSMSQGSHVANERSPISMRGQQPCECGWQAGAARGRERRAGHANSMLQDDVPPPARKALASPRCCLPWPWPTLSRVDIKVRSERGEPPSSRSASLPSTLSLLGKGGAQGGGYWTAVRG